MAETMAETTEMLEKEENPSGIEIELDFNPEEKDREEPVTEETAKEEGLTPEEIELAKKNEIFSSAKENASGNAGKEQSVKENQVAVSNEKKAEIKSAANDDLTPEEEKENLNKWNPNEKAMYWRFKGERKKRQAAEASKAELEKENIYLKAQLQAREEIAKNDRNPASDPLELEEIEEEDLFTGAEVKKLIADIKTKKASGQSTVREEEYLEYKQAEVKAQKDYQILQRQGQEASTKYQDFDEVGTAASEIMRAIALSLNGSNEDKVDGEIFLEEMFNGDREKVLQARKLAEDISVAMLSGGVNKYGEKAVDLAYKLGSMHPKIINKKTEEVKNQQIKKVEAERVEKMIANSQKVKIPASISGGGRAVVPYSELKPEDITRMSLEQFNSLPEKVREKFLRRAE